MSCERADVVVIPSTVLVRLADNGTAEMPLEEYVKGSLPAYLEPEAPPEALRALAIAIRSGAAVSRQHARDGFDLCTGGDCLAWQPAGHSAESDRAVDETAGQVLVVRRAERAAHTSSGASLRVAAAPFFRSCDGHTRSSEQVWHSPLSHCLGAPCTCGHTELQGHGVGLCLAGASAMARLGTPAPEILKHYFAGAEVATAASVARSQLCQSLIVGRVVDSAGRPLGGAILLLSGAAGPFQRSVSSDGRFWFSELPAGQWELAVKGASVRRSDLQTDGRNTVEAQIIIPSLPALQVETMPVAHPKKLIGTLGYGGVPVMIIDSTGSHTTVESGSAPEFDPGGFAIPLPPAGACTLLVLGQRFTVDIDEAGLWVRFLLQTTKAPN